MKSPFTINKVAIMHHLFMFLFVLVMSSNSSAQNAKSDETTSTVLYRIVTTSGTEYVGTLIQDDGREVLIETPELGKLYIPKNKIASISQVKAEDSIVEGLYRDAGPFTTRYYFTNNALPIRKGEHYAMIHLYGPEMHFAVSNRLSIGVMATWIAAPIGLALKYSIPTKDPKWNFSVGTILASTSYLNAAKGFGGIHWGSVTRGIAGKNITFSAGYAYLNFNLGEDRLRSAPVVSLAGIGPVGRKASIIFDSMVFFGSHTRTVNGTFGNDIKEFKGPRTTIIFMPAMRFQTKETMAFQVAMAGVIQYSAVGYGDKIPKGVEPNAEARSFPIPMCSWLLKF